MILPRLACALLALCTSACAWAGVNFCERPLDINAAQQDRVLRFAAAIKRELEDSGARVALISRAGLDLSRFKLLYSHAGVALKDNPNGAWSVRQLYYACDESRPRLFDQGMSGFVLGAELPAMGHVSLVLLPQTQSQLLEAAALNKQIALTLLAGTYSANAYAFSTRYQNCNQWVAELIAAAWGHADAREDAQRWLREQGYQPRVAIPSHWLAFAAQFVPLVHVVDHPVEDLQALSLKVSVPASIESFVHQAAPQARRVELCHDARHIVVHRGWEALGTGCDPMPGDQVIALSD